MKLLELHILQQFPVSCLNRDDIGSPKTAIFGGVNRARISSQCLKRAIRLYAKEHFPETPFAGFRTRLLIGEFSGALQRAGMAEAPAREQAEALAKVFSTVDKKDTNRVTTAVFLSPAEVQETAQAVAVKAQQSQISERDLSKIVKGVQRLDAADIALFGRMVANDATLNVEGAAMFGHALSTHQAENDIDFFAAVDDRKEDSEDAGAGMIGTLEFTSAVYYRYGAVNLDLLFSKSHLGSFSQEQRRAVLEAFLRSTLLAVPGARHNSMNSHTLPAYVLGLYKAKGQPVQLINAFDPPARAERDGGLVGASIKKLREEEERLRKTWRIEVTAQAVIPDLDINAFCQTLLAHAVE